MPRFAANLRHPSAAQRGSGCLSMMYSQHAFLDRIAAAGADGFEAVGFLFPCEHAPIKQRSET